MTEPTPSYQPAATPPPPAPAKKKGLPPLAWVGIGCGALVVIALIVFAVGSWLVAKKVRDVAGEFEANPAMAGLARNSAALFAVKAGTAAATTYFAERLSRNHPRAATIMMAVLNTAYVAIVAHNYRVANR